MVLTRECCCESIGETLCSVHWLHKLRLPSEGNGRIFSVSKHYFARRIKELARDAGFELHARFGTHAFRRGMAQETVDLGVSLATVMEAGGWTSSAYRVYLRGAQVEDMAVARAIIQLSDSDAE